MIKSISQSLIGTFTRCPEQVRRRYFLGDIIPPGIAAKIGTGVHGGAEVNHVAKMNSGKDEPLDVIQDAARDKYYESIKDGVFVPPDEAGRKQIILSEGVDWTVKLTGLYHKSLAPLIMPVAVEQKWYMDDEDFSVPWSGIIDVVDRAEWMPDIKTAAKRWSVVKASGLCQRAETSPQRIIYNELYRNEYGHYPEKFTFEVLTKTKEPKHQSIETSPADESDFLALKERVKIMMKMLEAGIFPPADPESWICSWNYCGFWWTCPHIAEHRKQTAQKGLT